MTRTQISKNTHPHGEQLSAYIDSMLDVARMRGIGEHLHTCAACRRIEVDLRQTKVLVHSLPDPPVPGPEFWASAYRTLRVDDQERASVQRPLWASWRGLEQAAYRRWAGGLAACALAAGLFAARPPAPVMRPAISPVVSAAPAPDVSPDVTSLAELHTDSVSRLPLADPDRQKMIAADARQPEPSSAGILPSSALEAAGYADAAY